MTVFCAEILTGPLVTSCAYLQTKEQSLIKDFCDYIYSTIFKRSHRLKQQSLRGPWTTSETIIVNEELIPRGQVSFHSKLRRLILFLFLRQVSSRDLFGSE